MNTGQKLWTRAKRAIPGGSMLLSKRPEMFLPDYWPVYFKKTEGCRVWDLDNNGWRSFRFDSIIHVRKIEGVL